jgi:ribonuclease P protein component
MISGQFPKSHRLLKSSQFQSFSKNSNVFSGKALYIVWKTNGRTHARLGITVTKKYGDAWKRNRFKRLVREAFRVSQIKEFGVDIHVRPKGSKVKGKIEDLPSFADVASDFTDLVAYYTHQ